MMANPYFWVNFTSFIMRPKKGGRFIMRILDELFGDISVFVYKIFQFAAK